MESHPEFCRICFQDSPQKCSFSPVISDFLSAMSTFTQILATHFLPGPRSPIQSIRFPEATQSFDNSDVMRHTCVAMAPSVFRIASDPQHGIWGPYSLAALPLLFLDIPLFFLLALFFF